MNGAARRQSETVARARELLARSLRTLFVFGGVAPFVPAWTEGIPGLAVVGRAFDAWFSFQCHRDDARTWFTSAVCARCLGIYVGLAFGALIVRPRFRPKHHALWMGVAAVVLVADVLSEAFGLRPPFAPLRFATGFFLAYPAAVSIVRALSANGSSGVAQSSAQME